MDFHGSVQTLSMANEDQVFISQESSLLLCNLNDSQGAICQKGAKVLSSCVHGSRFFTGTAVGALQIFDLETRSKLGEIKVKGKVLSISVADDILVAGCQNGNVIV